MAKGWNDERPMSPHLTIWKWHPTMLSSILHRATGIVLYIGLLKICFFLAALAMGPKYFDRVKGIIYSPLGTVAFFVFFGILIYHFLNGLRHLFWDIGKGFDPKFANGLSLAIIVASIVIAAALTYVLVGSF
ncbi:MAG TPA: succinate dehydrogenase, cytochrome b556 subunit [Hellea balneolensis]|uniref:Succinate dehydrogenase cytochrome b556 subunit n=1 Tax=Hellea balneolensis TaxID=287478 RepID=A0A7C5M159_9PROT|nr:succinate dehydrogenase, cytochrome b556 subunit [Hellea balneolensis]